jgi:exonuclease VII small subunit
MEGSTLIDITFADAYDELKTITEELNGSDAIGPERLLHLLKRGKGLERVLRKHLDDVEQEVKNIEAGDSYVPFRIVAETSAGPSEICAVDVDTGDFIPASPAARATDDDIPF